MSEEKQEQQEPEVIGPGALLKEARIKAGLSVAEIAEKLRLKVCNIENLEADVYDESISMTFTKGYLKLYAKQVQLPEAEVLEAFDKLNTKGKEPAKLQSFSRRVARQASDDRLMLVTYLIVFGVIALVVIWWLQQSNTDSALNISNIIESDPPAQQTTDNPNSSQLDESPAAIAEPAEDSSRLVEPSSDSLEGDEPAQTEESAGGAPSTQVSETNDDRLIDGEPALTGAETEAMEDTPQTTAQDLSVPTDNLQNATAAQDAAESEPDPTADFGDPVELVFQFSGDCWMNLVDATGEAIAYGVKASGRVMPVSGVPPFEVTLGAPESVQITYDGTAVDMSQFRAGRTARFTLPLSQ